MKKIHITETVLRDANQSLIATRLPFNEFAPILKDLDNAGYYSLECWGGATFDSCLRYLNEDPWERLKKIKSIVKKTPLQMLLRGQNILGYKHYPDDVVREFVKMSVYHGMDIIRIFDALNDFSNIEVAMDETIKQGAHAQGTIVYTVSPIHDVRNYTNLAKQLENMGAHSICIKDMAGLIMPNIAHDLVKSIKSEVKIPVFLHSHCTNGLAEMSYYKAAEAGVDGIDTAISSFSSGTSQPPTETMHQALTSAGFNTNLSIDKLTYINNFFKPIRAEVLKSGLLDPKVLTPQPEGLTNQIPGGMLSNMISQLKSQNSIDKLDSVLAEVPRVREDLGFPPLVTPMSQMVGTQATVNVLTGERYKMVLKEVKAYCKGEYGRSPGKINEEVMKKALGDDYPIKGRFADSLEPAFEKTKEILKDKISTNEDVLSYLAFPQIAEEFFKNRASKPSNEDLRFQTKSEVI
ncbi:HMGL-like family protein [Clostridium argentinense CDC 2741]|uniref:HMGL-like family protein n=1 Tax=Clostridium argentinense CDC 2741 TaxID=1418104 RepID=A0A0C1RDE2_9CLOT|nr:pyruvate carboxylase subunit B [Clostridium argentinense]ARC83292.1 oxaloacetate decarboxylase [Clostridium argentinense]KIE48401.1 HMGL-like family protein [Clostridium argentinense CDC 2741]NFF41459.1 pyruvate carboxylase subunit B [Clostridium argentinense]NFP52121.1 pyruvate carboxylase subunit B [Clostridium argentinense]NFP74498.1 pyruvate carboxylase subunit B [Clostridium argentinense]